MDIRKAIEADDPILVTHYLALWESYGIPKEHLSPDARDQVLAFIREGRRCRCGEAFLAAIGGRIVGSVACQVHISPYPEVVMPQYRRLGYVWSVYVDPDQRRQGIARELMNHAIAHLREVGCTMIALHSSDAGENLYLRLGFERAKEMRLRL
jgi:ribosomal protein S18 acetylase RimI-like enzyme